MALCNDLKEVEVHGSLNGGHLRTLFIGFQNGPHGRNRSTWIVHNAFSIFSRIKVVRAGTSGCNKITSDVLSEKVVSRIVLCSALSIKSTLQSRPISGH